MRTRLGRLTVATVVPFDGGADEERAALAALDTEKQRLASLAPGLEVLKGHPATALIARANEDGYDLVAIGTRGRGGAHLFGSTAAELARTSKIPVLLVGDGGNQP
jgi:nucleotide-binding universal stress UspA family protein